MDGTPSIDVGSSNKSLNRRFKKDKSNWLMFLVAGVLGIGLIVTAILLNSGKRDENQQDVATRDNRDQRQAAKEIGLKKSSIEIELPVGQEAKFDVGKLLQNAQPGECRIDWDLAKSNLPRAALESISINNQLEVTVPTKELVERKTDLLNSKAEGYVLYGKVVKGEEATAEFSLRIKTTVQNSPPKINVPAVALYHPWKGGEVLFEYSDPDSSNEELGVELKVDDGYRSIFEVKHSQGKSVLGYRPKVVGFEDISVELVVRDPDGDAASGKVVFRPDVKNPTIRMLQALNEIQGFDFSKINIGRLGQISGGPILIDKSRVFIEESRSESSPNKLPRPEFTEPYTIFEKDGLVIACESPTNDLTEALKKIMGRPTQTKLAVAKEENESSSRLLETATKLFEGKKLFQSKSFAELVFAYVSDFENENQQVLQQKYKEYPGLEEFFEQQKGFKAELFLAIDPAYDNLASALNVINEIWKKHPKDIVIYKNLAIAIAVCWDVPNANYSFTGHQRRTKSTLRQELTGALQNFEHFVTYKDQMQGRAQWLPWEFLVHVINHQTPDKEKYWALENYLAKRINFGQCYKDVPYDYEMLKTGSQVCKLNGHEYSLPNLKSIGGVCAMQADFASRVGKSLGVPSEYVGGKSASGGNHAWVMWVEVKNVTKSSIAFSLESYGRYRGDLYYVGNLKDPKSGKRITDRQLELRLHTVGTNAYAKRQVDLIMRVFPQLVKSQDMGLKDQLDFLEQAIKVCPWHDLAWESLADLIASSEKDRKMNRQMNQILNSMFVHFGAFPDFTWKIFDRLISFVEKDDDRNKYYVKLLNLYVAGKRPDLACEAQLKLTDYLEEQEKTQVAMQGLAVTIKTFPDEGRYVPRLLDRLEKLVGDDPDLLKQLVQFHADFLPLIPQKRGSSASKYCMQMYQRAIKFFTKHGVTELANAYQLKLQELQALPK